MCSNHYNTNTVAGLGRWAGRSSAAMGWQMHPGARWCKGCLWVPLCHLPNQINSATVSFGQLSKSVTLYDSASYNSSARWLFVLMFPRLVYVPSIRTQVHSPNICLVIVIAFPQLVYLATRRSEWHLLPGRKSFVWLPSINERRESTMPISVATLSKAWVCCLSLVRIAGSNPAAGVDVCLLWVLCVVR